MRLALAAATALIASHAGASRPEAAPGDLLLRNARLIDGTGAPPRGVDLLVRSGRIAAIGPGLSGGGAPALDAQGATVLPGLIDSHVHLSMTPGAAHRNDPPELTRALLDHHLRAYLACGVTTVLDTAIPPESARDVQSWLAAGHPGPRFLLLSPALVSPGGYGSFPGLGLSFAAVATPEEIEERFRESEPLASVGVKVTIEYGFGPLRVWPIHSPEMRAAIVRSAARHGKPLYVHATSAEEQSIALDMGAHVLVHPGFDRGEPPAGFLARLRERGSYVMTTLAIYDAWLSAYHPERLDEPGIRLTVPEVELATARDPEAARRLFRTAVAQELPRWVPEALSLWLARRFLSEERLRGMLHNQQRAVRILHDAGIPVVLGSDSGNWPLIPYEFHGPTTAREVELLAQAGLAPADVIAAATRTPAGMLGLADEIGTVEVGKRADLVVVRGDPLAGVSVLRNPAWTIRNGVARTPEQWLHGPRADDSDLGPASR
jgi:imidazolonepropionase-like amidohydrolase